MLCAVPVADSQAQIKTPSDHTAVIISQNVKTFEAILYAADEREAKAAMAAVQEAPRENGTRASFDGLDIASESLDGLNLQQHEYPSTLSG